MCDPLKTQGGDRDDVQHGRGQEGEFSDRMGAADPLEAVAGREAARGPHEPRHRQGPRRLPGGHKEAAAQGGYSVLS